jgi:hypothetical protein
VKKDEEEDLLLKEKATLPVSIKNAVTLASLFS